MKHSIKFALTGNDESRPIRMRVSFAGLRAEIYIGYSVEPDKWLAGEERVKRNAKNRFGQSAAVINAAIDRARVRAEEIFSQLDASPGMTFTVQQFKEIFAGAGQRHEKFTVEAAIDKFMSERSVKNSWAELTEKKFDVLRNSFHRYKPSYPVAFLSEKILTGYIEWLQDRGLNNSTVQKYSALLRGFVRWCFEAGLTSEDLHDCFTFRLKGTDGACHQIIYLEWPELQRLLGYDFGNTNLDYIRDIFCLCCFTGLRFSDVYKLKWSDIDGDTIRVVTRKTSDALTIELNAYSRRIIEKYRDYHLPNDAVLPVVKNNDLNMYLKIACQTAGIDSPQRIVYFTGSVRHEEVYPKYALITSHSARRTFVVNALRLGIPVAVIMSWTGHRNYNSMRPYIKIVNDLKEREMKKFDSLLPEKAPESAIINTRQGEALPAKND